MRIWRTRGWLLPAALAAGVLGLALTEVAMLRQKQGPAPATATVNERIGLIAQPDGDALELQWDRSSRPLIHADHAIVYIQDGKYQSQLELTERQLSNARVRYWPESKQVSFRMEVYHGTASTSDTVQVAVTVPSRGPLRQAVPGSVATRAVATRAVVEKVSPSPFVRARPRARPQMVRNRSPRRAQSVVSTANAKDSPQAVDPEPVTRARQSGFNRVVSKIPLLRRLKKHPQSADSKQPADNLRRP